MKSLLRPFLRAIFIFAAFTVSTAHAQQLTTEERIEQIRKACEEQFPIETVYSTTGITHEKYMAMGFSLDALKSLNAQIDNSDTNKLIEECIEDGEIDNGFVEEAPEDVAKTKTETPEEEARRTSGAVNSAMSPLDFIGGGGVAKGAVKGVTKGVKALSKKNNRINLNVKTAPKIVGQLKKRGWTQKSILNTIKNPSRTKKGRDYRRNKATGKNNNDPATYYYDKNGNYVIRNDRTGDIVQISNKNKPDWKQ